MTINELKNEYQNRYENDSYSDDPATKNVLTMIDTVSNLSPTAQNEFMRKFSFDFAGDGQIFIGSQREAAASTLAAECLVVGFTLTVERGRVVVTMPNALTIQ